MLITAAEARNWSHKKIDDELCSLIYETNVRICETVRFGRDRFCIFISGSSGRDSVDQIGRMLLAAGYEYEVQDVPLLHGVAIIVILS
jgi:hypothetical protein